jgi:hypothetical protein
MPSLVSAAMSNALRSRVPLIADFGWLFKSFFIDTGQDLASAA